jgi:hypothetical protein
MAQIEGLQVNIIADIKQLQKSLDEVKKAFASVAQDSQKQAEKISDPLKGAADAIEARYGSLAGNIASRLIGLVNPATLAATAITAIGAAILSYATKSEENIKTVDQLFSEHADTVRRVALVYPELTKGLETLAQEANNILQTRLRGDIVNFTEQLQTASEAFINSIAQTTPTATSAIEFLLQKFGAMKDTVLILDKNFEPFRRAIFDFQNSVRSGSPDMEAFKTTLAEIAMQFQDNENIQKYARELLEVAKNAETASLKLQGTKSLLRGTQDEASGAATALRTYNETIKTLEGIAPKQIDDLTRARRAATEALKDENLTTAQAKKIREDLAAAEKRLADQAASRVKTPRVKIDNSEEQLAREQESITKRLEMLTVGWGTEEEKLAAHLIKNQDLITQARAKEAIDDETHKILMAGAEEEYQKKMEGLRMAGMNSALTATGEVFSALGRVVQAGSKKNVRLAKMFGVAEAIIATMVAANKAMAVSASAGPAAAFAAWAAVAAKGLATVAAIRSVSESGGGGSAAGAASGGGSGGGAAAADGGGAAGRGPGGNSVYINLQGQSFGRDQVRDLVKQIADFQKDGGQVVFA